MPEAPLPTADLAALRATLARIESKLDLGETGPQSLRLNIADIDHCLGGGFKRGTLHAIRAPHAGLGLAAFGFALALLACGLAQQEAGDIAIISEASGRREMGRLYAPGLASFALAPERLWLIEARTIGEVLIAAEECLAEPGLAGVLIELASPANQLERVAARRLLHASSRGHGLGFLVQTGPAALRDDLPLWTRWQVAPGKTHANPCLNRVGPGPPAFSAQLEKNRRGPLGAWQLRFEAKEARFCLLDPAATLFSSRENERSDASCAAFSLPTTLSGALASRSAIGGIRTKGEVA